MDRFELRLKLLVVLEERRLLRGTSDHAMSVPLCSRSGDVVEPLLRPQWFVRMGPMAARAVQAVETGRLSIAPAHFKTVWFDWLRHIQDWCVSRQLWWGHRIPAYRCRSAASPNGARHFVTSLPSTVEFGYIIHLRYHPAAYIGHFRPELNFYIIKPPGISSSPPVISATLRGARGKICALRAAKIAPIAGVAA